MKLPLPDFLFCKPQKRTATELGSPMMQTVWTRRKQAWGDKASWAEGRWVNDWEGIELWSILHSNVSTNSCSTDTLSGFRGPSFGTLGRSNSTLCWLALRENSELSSSTQPLSHCLMQIFRSFAAGDILWPFVCEGEITQSCCLNNFWELLQTKENLVIRLGHSLDLRALPGVLSTAKSSWAFQHWYGCHLRGESSLQTKGLQNKSLSKLWGRKTPPVSFLLVKDYPCFS